MKRKLVLSSFALATCSICLIGEPGKADKSETAMVSQAKTLAQLAMIYAPASFPKTDAEGSKATKKAMRTDAQHDGTGFSSIVLARTLSALLLEELANTAHALSGQEVRS